MKRVFILKKGNDTLTLEDPDSRMSLSEVTDSRKKSVSWVAWLLRP